MELLLAASSCNTTCASLGCSFYDRSCPCACNHACESHHDCCRDYSEVCIPSGGPAGGPEQHHLSLTHDPTEIVVSFATSADLHGISPSCTLLEEQRTFTGASHTYTEGGWKGLLHTRGRSPRT